jgi:hypothetical protein
MRFPTPSPHLLVLGGLALSDFEQAEALADRLGAQFQLVNDPSEPAIIEMIIEEMRAYEYVPTSEQNLSSSSVVLEAKGFKAGNAAGPKILCDASQTQMISVFRTAKCSASKQLGTWG